MSLISIILKLFPVCFAVVMTGQVLHGNTARSMNFVSSRDFQHRSGQKGAVMYQIFTDRFYNGDKSNDVKSGEYYYINRQTKQVENWDKCPEDFDVANFYGGDLQGVLDKMDYLEELGVEVIYFNPLFVSASSHKYDTQDYDYIDPHFGVIVEDGGEPLPEWCNDNSQASLYKARVTIKESGAAMSCLSSWWRKHIAVACV